MKEYKYIYCSDISRYSGWDIVKIISGNNGDSDMAVIMKEDKPIQNYIKLNEATKEQLLEELSTRIGSDE